MPEKMRLLIVDDEQMSRDFFNLMFSKLGFIVELAVDGEEALEKVKSFPPDIIMLDTIMPKLSGWKVTRILKNDEEYAEFRDVPIIMFSAMDDVKDKIEGFELGAVDYITKPFNFSEVLARVRAVSRNRELLKGLLEKEKRIAQIRALNDSLVFFTQHLKQPMNEMRERAQNLRIDDPKAVQAFVGDVLSETDKFSLSLAALEDEIAALSGANQKEDEARGTLRDLERKFQKHFAEIGENSLGKRTGDT